MSFPEVDITENAFLYKVVDGYFADNPTFFTGKTVLSSGYVTDLSSIGSSTNNYVPNDSSWTTYSVEWIGFFRPPTSGTWTFYTTSDDASYMWLGLTAVSGYTTSNALVNNGGLHSMVQRSGTISLDAGQIYPVRIQFGQNAGGDGCQVAFRYPGGGVLYYQWESVLHVTPPFTIPDSGPISLNDIHVAVGGESGTLCSINDLDVRDLISKGSAELNAFSEYRGKFLWTIDSVTPTNNFQHVFIIAIDNLNRRHIFDVLNSDATYISNNGSIAGKIPIKASGQQDVGYVICSDGSVHQYDYTTQTYVTYESGSLAGKTVTGISSGRYHTIFLCDDGSVHTSGTNNYFGQLGTSPALVDRTPQDITTNGDLSTKSAIKVQTGYYSCLVTCSDASLIQFGSRKYGVDPALYPNGTHVPTIIHNTGILKDKIITSVSCNWNHVFYVCSDGTVYASGDDSNGKLGNGPSLGSNNNSVVDISGNGSLAGKHVIQAVATRSSSAFLCSDGTVHVCGRDSNMPTVLQEDVPIDITGYYSESIGSLADGGVEQYLAINTARTHVWRQQLYTDTYIRWKPLWISPYPSLAVSLRETLQSLTPFEILNGIQESGLQTGHNRLAIRIVGSITASRGILYERGAGTSGFALYLLNGILYCQGGFGGAAGGTVEFSYDMNGEPITEVVAYFIFNTGTGDDQQFFSVNNIYFASKNVQYSGGVTGTDPGGTGQVYRNICVHRDSGVALPSGQSITCYQYANLPILGI